MINFNEDEEFIKACDMLLEAQSVSIYTHINTDCDAMGSSLALREALLSMGKKVDLFVHSTFPTSFRFFGDLSFINQKTCDGYDLAVCLDCSNESRMGKFKYSYRKKAKKTLLIDHHAIANEKFCSHNLVRWFSSTAEILYFVLCGLDVELTSSICKNLIAGIITDTGNFAHSATPQTFEVVAKLLNEKKLVIEDIFSPLFQSMPMPIFKMLKLAYQRMELLCDNRFALIMFSHDDFVKHGTNYDELDAFPDIPLQIGDVKIAILASEDDRGYFRVSIRSKGEVSARIVAESFGGSGHFNASGCKIFGEFAEVRQKLIDSVTSCLGWKL